LTAFNSLAWPRQAIVKRNDGFYRMAVPAMGFTQEKGERLDALTVSAGEFTLENRFLKATFDEITGALVSCVDKRTGREALRAPGNRYAVYTEENADCWDIAIEYTDRKPEYFTLMAQSCRVLDDEAICFQKYAYGDSSIVVKAKLGEDDEYLTFDTQIDWQEQDKMLRTSFDTSVTTDRAGFDIQYGLLHRSNNENTLWDKAQFEECGHKWIDLSESDWGVSLLNDCKYGFRVKGSVLDMNILRAQHYPSNLTDKGTHTLSYALYPHAGNEKGGRVKEKAYEFNIPLRFAAGEVGEESRSLMHAQGAIVESLKAAEDGNGQILRVYEPYGTHAKMEIALDGTYTITPCDLMEQAEGAAFSGDGIHQEIKPFEILTFRLEK
ncbi:MAG: glycoside hydrolase family 38 C-terminal domain-containing protein, partial [Eubacteriales bacterium]|nr:glycoside hydrolase family 38 C-terminal domain-containing protein [Eubacteriales bacterium]